jgi:hypothetical protein
MQKSPVTSINLYLKGIYKESIKRNFNFNGDKIGPITGKNVIPVTEAQVTFEFEHLLKKLKERDKIKYQILKNSRNVKLHPLFIMVPGYQMFK